ncbi:TOX high mobility group box family member 4-like isoform X3 [Limulus polyphemus]|uniref:TOX high mobility group box family member 4-like isoform X3 n=1 Tax=Limulus polyphemus TaxID=6850 RepID=A0ABM1SJN0_LIMPO|nr:TOX high mobility group box family member 4-like isoform X3 [Limulus polyphemus]
MASNNFDLQTLNLQDSNQNPANFVSVDQTFHTPSFGDEEFGIPTLSMPSSDGNGNTGDIFESQALSLAQAQSQGMTIVMTSSPSTTVAPQGIVESPTVQYPGHNMDEMYLPQMREIQPGGRMEMQNIQMLAHSYENRPSSYDQMQQRQSQMQTMPPPQVPDPLSTQPSVINGHASLLTTISQTQLMTQLGMKAPLGMARQQGPGSMGSSPGSNHTSPGQETSEDSDDSIPLLMGGVKRPSPEPVEPVSNTKSSKKPKVPKKKKKKDPNEPQKPVSAYALFFRDTQAAIKGQNPNASFGEVSKIVASMWDSLDVDHKNVYKKKTEAAKKEYLKALAAYKASLVSRAGAEQSDLYSNPSVSSTTPMTTVAYSGHSPPSLSPLQKKSPLLTSLMEGSTASVVMTQPQAPLVASQVWTQAPQQHIVQGAPLILQQQGQILQIHNHQMAPLATAYNQNMQGAQLVSDQTMHVSQNMGQQPQIQQTCLRNGCPNPAIESPDWDKEYCSNECVVSHCRDVFTAWVASRQASNSFTQVK